MRWQTRHRPPRTTDGVGNLDEIHGVLQFGTRSRASSFPPRRLHPFDLLRDPVGAQVGGGVDTGRRALQAGVHADDVRHPTRQLEGASTTAAEHQWRAGLLNRLRQARKVFDPIVVTGEG
jgi:hypothetical protein